MKKKMVLNMALNNKSKTATSKESQKRYKAFEKRINEMNLDDLDLTVALGSIRLDKYMCSQCRERTNCPPFKLSILQNGDEFFSDDYLDYSFDSIECLIKWARKLMLGSMVNLSDCSNELNKNNGN